MVSLKRLYLSNNKLAAISNLLDLNKLEYLDVSFNLLEDVSSGVLPDSLTALVIEGNPLLDEVITIKRLEERLPGLKYINDSVVNSEKKTNRKDSPMAALESRLDTLFTEAKAPIALGSLLKSTQMYQEESTEATEVIGDKRDLDDLGETPTRLATIGANNLRMKHKEEFNMAVLQYDTHMQAFKNRQAIRKSQEGQQ